MDEFDARLGEIILVPNVATLTEVTAEGEPVGYAVGSSTYALVLIREERQEDGQVTVHTRWAKRFNEAETPFSMQAAFNALHELQRAILREAANRYGVEQAFALLRWVNMLDERN